MWLYNFGLTCYVWIIRLVAPRHPKARLWINGRKDLYKRMAETIDPAARIVWIHVASLGEFEQGRPIIERIRKEHPEYKILLTFFSPSGYEIRKNYQGVDYIFYLPIDTPRNARRFLDAAHPEIAVFVKYEFWLNLLYELRRRKVRTYIVSAIFRRNSIFFRPYGGMWRQALESFDVMFVQNEESKKLLAGLGFDNVIVAGDTRFDRVAEIAKAAKHIDVIERFKGDKRVFVAGSTWGPDEELLIRLINDNPDIKFIVAPHEMDESRMARLAELFEIDNHHNGITNLIVHDHNTWDDIQKQILSSGVNSKLDLLMAGPVPPNPGELVTRASLDDIISQLKEHYDYVILDTAPVGLVNDSLQLGRLANLCVYVCRADYTPKASFGMINGLKAENKLPNMCLVLNGVDLSKKKHSFYYGVGKYGKYGKYGNYGSYGSYGKYGKYGTYGQYGSYGNYSNSHYGNANDNSIKK